jgi:pyruvate kinase
MRKCKIVCTLGPSTSGVARLVELIEAGMDVARLNLSHGDHESHRRTYCDLREAAGRVGRPVAVLLDLSGPKIRVGKMDGGAVKLERGASITLTTEPVLGTSARVSHSYAPLAHDVRPGDRILLDDGLLELQVEQTEGEEVRCRVVIGGMLKDKKGMNLPGAALSTPALTEKDKLDLAFGLELGVDYFALSFVRSADDVLEAKRLAGPVPVIAKIEKPEALLALDEVITASDGVMVARGDLGVELGHEKVPLAQKRIVHEVKLQARPVITATQMLESMVHSPQPTRAEVSDVANAVLDGTDAVMLSAETSIGEYPVEAVRTLDTIIKEIEQSEDYLLTLENRPHVLEHSFTNAISAAIDEIDDQLGLAAIAVYTESGRSAAFMSAHRPSGSLIAFSRSEHVLNRLALYWGVMPICGDWVTGLPAVVEQSERVLLERKLVEPGDDIAITYGMVVANEPFQTDTIKLWKVRG